MLLADTGLSDSAIATIVTGSVTVIGMIVGFATLWVKLKYGVEKVEEAAVKAKQVEDKLDDNTAITKENTTVAATNARAAADAASKVEITTNNINRKLNGGIDSAIAAAINPVHVALVNHIEQDARDMEEVKKILEDFVTNNDLKKFADYVHQRNHDLLGAMQINNNKMSMIMAKLGISLTNEGGK